MTVAKAKPKAEIASEGVLVLQAGTPVYLKTADVCAITGKSNQWIGQLTSQGILNKTQTSGGAMYELGSTMRAYIDMLASRECERDNDADIKKAKADASLKQAKATIATLDAKERLGQMHRSEDVEAMTSDLIFTIRNALMALPGRLAVSVAAANDAVTIAEIIRAEVYAIMEDLSRYKYDAAKYQERVRERLNLAAQAEHDDES